MIGVRLAEDLVNLACDGPWESQALCHLLRRSFVRAVDLAALDEETMLHLEGWTQQLRAVFSSGSVLARAERINEILDDGVRRIRLATHDGLPPHLHFADAEDELVQRVKALTAGGMAIFAVEAEAGRMGVCGRPGCARVFADTSKNGRRAYCSALCGNTHAVQRYRKRKQQSA
jgi:predicted RNA-binding Zn ribbon-like protein